MFRANKIAAAPDFWSDDVLSETTPMKEFYRGKTVFLTGGTGFLGQIYVEKLLRCEAKMVYVLARSKRDKTAHQRLNELFAGPLFVVLQRKEPGYMQRIRVVEGNTRLLGIGLEASVYAEIVENVNIILHAAADVRFDNTLQELSLVNLRGTRELLKLAERCKCLDMFTYISTAFSHCDRKVIEEKFYEPPIDPEQMIRIAEYYEEHPDEAHLLETMTEHFISPWPNTYSFSKALSEELMRQYGAKIPIVIMRPSVVISTHEDPIPAWSNNIYGLNGMLVACGLGFLRIMVFDRDLRGDVICADFVTNSTFAAMWDRYDELAKTKCSALASAESMEMGDQATVVPTGARAKQQPKIFNVTATDDMVSWGYISDTMRDMLIQYPTNKSIWCHLTNTTRYRIMEFFLVIFYHAIPGLVYDAVLKYTKNERRLMPLYRKTHSFMIKLRYFMTQEWTFCKANMFEVYDRMSPHDHMYFPCDVRKFNWDAYCYNYTLGLLRYIGNETLDEFDQARRRMRKFRIAHYFVLIAYYTLLAAIYYGLGHIFGINSTIRTQIERIL